MKQPLNTDVQKKVGLRIKEARKKARMTQDELATKTGISTASISKIEAGTTDPSLSRIEAIAFALDADILQLFGANAKNPDSEPIAIIQRRIAVREEELAILQRKAAFLEKELEKK
ncbi:helix-turn-helix domain-containing protein [Mucilaginibacter pedocola]|uniref:HTH cro/C1-type domain-containing protein n=1 Tax=Mucilaginibacter pedocola TaxID=1792845 RepID=A0A1S9PIL1_9SPHI|nr:helix-turn-helix transcriptional regulator [Mucilaginibacter pedocola]OOQ60408.1 hypothetical protein BC343_25685 [Mucilaginibacter pedocola]